MTPTFIHIMNGLAVLCGLVLICMIPGVIREHRALKEKKKKEL